MNIQTDRALLPAHASVVRYLVVSVTAPACERRTERPAVEVALVLDRSGSMGGSKIQLAKQAVDHAIALLHERDRLAVVCYDTEVDTLLGSTTATAEAKALATSRLRGIDARGGTDLCGGWLRGAQELEAHVPAGGSAVVRRVLLLSDGHANHGETDPDVLSRHAGDLRAKGINTSTFGLGRDFDEQLMSRMATEGGGNFYFIEQPAQIADVFMSELGETLEVVARDVRLVVAGGAGTEASCLNHFSMQREGGELSIRIGDLTSDQRVTVVLAVRCAAAEPGSRVSVSARLADRDDVFFPQPMAIEWQVTDAATDRAQPVSAEVLMAVATLLAEAARAEALDLNRRNEFDRATDVLRRAAAAIRALAPGIRQVEAVADALEAEQVDYQAMMSLSEQKSRHFAARSVLHSRTATGRARK